MAMMQCPECGREISDAAATCPHCGFPIGDKKPLRGMPKTMEEFGERAAEQDKEIAEAAQRSGCLKPVLIFLLVCAILFLVSFCSSGRKEQTSSGNSAYSQNAEQSEQAESVTLDELAEVIKETLWNNYENVEVTTTSDVLSVRLWNEGVAEEIKLIQQGKKKREDWNAVKQSIIKLSRNIQDVMKAGGQSNAHLRIDVLNDQNTEEKLLTVFDAVVTFDVLSK